MQRTLSRPPSLTLTAIILLIPLMAGVSSPVAAIDESSFRRLTTEHFVVWSDSSPAQVEEAGRTLEDLLSLILNDFPRLRVTVPRPFEVLFLDQKSEFSELTLDRVDRSLYKSEDDYPLGYLDQDVDRAFLIACRQTLDKYLASLTGELARVLVRAAIDDPPIWLEEGLNVYFATTQRSKDGYLVARTKKEKISRLQQSGFIPAGRLVKFPRTASFLKKDSDKENDARMGILAEFGFFITYLLYDPRPDLRPGLGSTVQLLIEGEDNETALLSSFRGGIIGLEEGFRQYVSAMRFPYTEILRSQLPCKPFSDVEPVARAEVDALIGDQYSRNGMTVRAEQFFSRGLASDSAGLPNQLGMVGVLRAQQQNQAALAKIALVREKAAADYAMLRACGFMLVRIGEKNQALEVFTGLAPKMKGDLAAAKTAASLALELARPAEAIPFINLILELQPSNWTWTEKIVTALQSTKNYKTAAAYALNMIQKSAVPERRVKLLITSLVGLTDENERASFLLHARKRLPDDPELNRTLGDLYRKQNNPAAALIYYRLCLIKAPGDAGVRQTIGELEKLIPATEESGVTK